MKSLQSIGAVFLVIAFILTIFDLMWYAILSLVIVGLIDIYLVVKDKQTISQRIDSLFDKKIDAGILIGLLVFTWWIWGPAGWLPVMLGVIMGHLFW